MISNDNEKEVFEEQLLLNGFNLVAVEECSKIPSDKKVFLLKTQDRELERDLRRWASKNNVVILVNPEKTEYEHCNRMFALVVDHELKDQLPVIESVKEGLIHTHHDLESIKDFLESIKDFLRIRKEHASI